jgi:hypothetical protein
MNMLGALNPYLLQIKLLAAALVIAASCCASWVLRGDVDRGIYEHEKLAEARQAAVVLQETDKHNDSVRQDNETKNLKETQDYEQALDQVKAERDRLRADMARIGGLRVERSAANHPGSTGAEAGGDRGNDAAAAADQLLPVGVAEDLQRAFERADETSETARACQQWVKDHGFWPLQ